MTTKTMSVLGFSIEIKIERASDRFDPCTNLHIEEYLAALESGLIEKAAEEIAYIQLNNLFLAVQRNEVLMSAHVKEDLFHLLCCAYPHGAHDVLSRNTLEDTMHTAIIEYWEKEFAKLPRWLEY